MAVAITYLSIPSDALAHAKRFGAQRDHATGRWYVAGLVHPELQNYIPRDKNRRFQEVAPPCPLCGAPTRKLFDRSRHPFWSCVTYPKTGCTGHVDYLDYLDDVAPSAPIRDYLRTRSASALDPAEQTPSATEETPHPLNNTWFEIVQEAANVLGGDRQAVAWLTQPKVAFHNEAPVDILGSKEGCDAVLKLLRDVWK
jgi:hypothetical protein